MVRLTGHLNMTKAVERDLKQQTKQKLKSCFFVMKMVRRCYIYTTPSWASLHRGSYMSAPFVADIEDLT